MQVPGVVGKTIQSNGAGRMESVLVLPATGKIEVINEVGTKIWSLSDRNHTIHEIAELICGEYAVELPIAEADVIEFVGLLLNKGIIALK